MSGRSNDAAIVSTPCRARVVMVDYWKDLRHEGREQASPVMADIAGVLYEHLGEPA